VRRSGHREGRVSDTALSVLSSRLRPAVARCLLLPAALSLLASTACRQDMQDQPKDIVYRENKFFKDGLSARPLVDGTVPRGWLRANTHLYTGKMVATSTSPPAAGAANLSAPAPGVNPAAVNNNQVDVTTFPFPITDEVMARGRERYQIFCSVCHGFTGEGDGMVVRRGYRKPPSYYSSELRKAPVGHFFDVITNGWASMPSYAHQIPAQDRWAIIAYVRALQASRPEASPAPPATASATPPSGGNRSATTGGQR
jgi:mono/diheme cytochrome c family protein